MRASLADLPDLKPRRELDVTMTIRLSGADRERLESTAEQLGVAPGRLVRAIVRRALADSGA